MNARIRTLVATLTAALVVASCSTGSRAPELEKPIAGDVSVCGLATAAEIEQATGQQVKRFGMYNSFPDDGFSCLIGFLGDVSYSFIDVELVEGYPRGLDSVPPGASFEEAEAHHGSQPIEIEGLDGRGIAIPDDAGLAAVAWAYPDNTYLTIRHSTPRSSASPRPDPDQDVEQLTALLALIGPTVHDAANGRQVSWTAYPSDPATAE